MSDTVWLAIIASVAPTIAAIAGLIVTIRNGRIAATKVDKLTAKTDQIHVLANDNLSRVSNELVKSNERLVAQEKLLAQMVVTQNTMARQSASPPQSPR